MTLSADPDPWSMTPQMDARKQILTDTTNQNTDGDAVRKRRRSTALRDFVTASVKRRIEIKTEEGKKEAPLVGGAAPKKIKTELMIEDPPSRHKGLQKCLPPKGRPLTPEGAVAWKIKVWWPQMNRFYSAKVLSYDSRTKKHLVRYRSDGVEQSLCLLGPKAESLKWIEGGTLKEEIKRHETHSEPYSHPDDHSNKAASTKDILKLIEKAKMGNLKLSTAKNRQSSKMKPLSAASTPRTPLNSSVKNKIKSSESLPKSSSPSEIFFKKAAPPLASKKPPVTAPQRQRPQHGRATRRNELSQKFTDITVNGNGRPVRGIVSQGGVDSLLQTEGRFTVDMVDPKCMNKLRSFGGDFDKGNEHNVTRMRTNLSVPQLNSFLSRFGKKNQGGVSDMEQ